MEKKAPKLTPGYQVGARPPKDLSPKAKRQLARMKPSKKAQELAELAAKVLYANGRNGKTSMGTPEPAPAQDEAETGR